MVILEFWIKISLYLLYTYVNFSSLAVAAAAAAAESSSLFIISFINDIYPLLKTLNFSFVKFG